MKDCGGNRGRMNGWCFPFVGVGSFGKTCILGCGLDIAGARVRVYLLRGLQNWKISVKCRFGFQLGKGLGGDIQGVI